MLWMGLCCPAIWRSYSFWQLGGLVRGRDAIQACLKEKSCRALLAFVNGKTQKLTEANGSLGMGVGAATLSGATREFWYRLLTGPVW